MQETKDKISPDIPVDRFDEVITELAQAGGSDVSISTKTRFREELLTLVFGDKYSGWFFGFKRVFTILFVPILFILMLVWLWYVAYFLWYAAFHKSQFELSDSVLIAMITSTTATIIGLFHYAARWMFAIDKNEQSDEIKPKE